jgi:hypothetical protein
VDGLGFEDTEGVNVGCKIGRSCELEDRGTVKGKGVSNEVD